MKKIPGCFGISYSAVWLLFAIALYPPSKVIAQSSLPETKSFKILGVIKGLPGRGLLLASDGCQPASTNKSDTIDCTGTINGGTEGKRGSDTITVHSGAVLTTDGAGSQTGIDGGKGIDTLLNHGQVVVSTSGPTATSTGIAGAAGNDDIQNHAELSAASNAINSRGGIVIFRGSAATSAESTAMGIHGGTGDDTITNTGSLTATADAAASSINSSININFRKLDASIDAVATATGIDGGKGQDHITTGAITVTANAEASSSNSSFQPIDLKVRFRDLDASTNATATATGIVGGKQGGEITHKESSTITAEAKVNSTDYNISFANVDAAIGSLDASFNATAVATGIASGSASKTTLEDGSMDVVATATAIAGGLKATGADLMEQSTALNANATAIGVAGGNPGGSITNAGDLTVNSSATATTLSGEFSLFDRAQADAITTSIARATGIGAEEGTYTITNGDELTNSGSLTVTATATGTALGAVVGIKAPPRLLGGPESKFTASAEATAQGIATSDGSDTITNHTTMQVTATATGFSGNFTFEKDGAADVEAVAAAHATATGIASGAGNDTITNKSTLTVKAESTSHAVDLAYGQADDLIPIPSIPELLKGKPPETDAGRIATAQSTGIDSGAGDDGVTNGGAITADATSLATSTAVSVSIETEDDDDDDKKGKKPGKFKKVIGFVKKNILDLDFLNDALIDTSVGSEATSTGIAAGDGQNTVTIDASVKGSATATTLSTSALLDFTITKKEDPEGKSFIFKPGMAKSQATATAHVTGISSGSGDDTITNNNEIDFTATAGANSLGVAAINQPKLSGVGLTSAMSDTSTITSAAATGITSGGGNDTITNNVGGTVSAKSASHAFADSVAVNVEAEGKGLEIGAALTNSKTTSEATAVGIDAGSGADHVTNAGTLIAEAVGRANSLSASISVQGAVDGVGIHAALSNSSTNTTATASGIQTTDSTADTLDNPGSMTVKADAGASAQSGSLGVQLGGNGLEIAAALTRSDTTATADAVGIQSTGNGSTVTSGTIGTGTGTLTVDAIAKSNSLGISVNVQKDVNGVGIAGALSDTTTHTNANAVGIKNSGLKGEQISNYGALTARADSRAFAESVGVNVQTGGGGVSAGAALTRSGTRADATATGINAGAASQSVVNEGDVTGEATAIGNSLGISFGFRGENTGGVSLSAALSDAKTEAVATGTGISSQGPIAVDFSNIGDITGKADAQGYSESASVTIQAGGTGLEVGAALARSGTLADATARGIDLAGGNQVGNEGLIKADADAMTNSFGLTLAGQGSVKGLGLQVALTDTETIATARATGASLIGGDNIYTQFVGGETVAEADSSAATETIAVTFSGFSSVGGSIGVALARSGVQSNANAVGLAGEGGVDSVTNAGTVTATSNATAKALGISVGFGLTEAQFAAQGAAVDASSHSEALATGVTSGAGADTIQNDGTIDVAATATTGATTVGATVVATTNGVALGAALVRGTTEAHAAGTAIDAGHDDDWVINNKTIASSATAQSTATGISAGLTTLQSGAAFAGTGADTSAKAGAQARGLDGGFGNDTLENFDSITAIANSTAATTTVSVTVSAAMTGLTGGAALGRATTEAESYSAGMEGNAGNDTIINQASVVSTATATTDSIGALVGIGFTNAGVALSGAGGDTSLKSIATANGLTGGTGADLLRNKGSIAATSTSNVDTDTFAVNVSGTGTGLSVGGALIRSKSEGNALSTGIAGDDDNDKLVNTGTVSSSATSTVNTRDVSVSLGVTGTGVAVDATAVDASATSLANAAGLSGSTEADVIYNKGAIDAVSNAQITTKGYSVSASGTVTGVGAGVALSRATTTAVANSMAIAGDHFQIGIGDDGQVVEAHTARDGADSIENRQALTATATANAEADSTSVSLGLTGTGLQVGGALADLRNSAVARATGISGGAGQDVIDNYDAITANSNATASGASVSVALQGNLAGVAVGVALTNATTQAKATSTGISGDDGDDHVFNEGVLGSSAKAEATATSVAVSAPLAIVPLGAALANSSATANAHAYGIVGGAGNDVIDNRGAIAIGTVGAEEGGADARATGRFVAASVIGASIGNANAIAEANAIGIDGGAGADIIDNNSTVTATARSDSTGTAVTVTLIGASIGDARAEATANAVAIRAGSENDTVINRGNLTTDAISEGRRTSVKIALDGAGASAGKVSSEAHATSIGIDGGDGNDAIDNQGGITSTANATMQSGEVAVSLAGFAGANANIQAIANATGIDGGNGDDSVLNFSTIEATSTATTTAHNVTVELAGLASSSENALTATTNASGILGNEGNDFIKSKGDITVTASSTTTLSGSTVNIFGASQSGGTTNTNVTSVGLDGGGGDDVIRNFAKLNVGSTGTMTIDRGNFEFAGATSAAGSLTSNSSATGIAGGTGMDSIRNYGEVEVTSSADLTAIGDTKAIFGSTNTDAALTANASAVGINGGEGADSITNSDLLKATSSAAMTSSRPSFTAAGSSSANALLQATSQALGIDGGAGDDSIYNSETIEVTATSSQTATGGSKALIAGSVEASATSTATARATGVDGGAGKNSLHNDGVIRTDANPTGNVTNNSNAGFLFGSSGAVSAITLTANSRGAGFGDDVNTIFNNNLIDVRARSSGTAASTANGADVINGDTVATATTTVDAFAYGVVAGNGANSITNNQTIKVLADPAITANAHANGNGADGDGTGNATATVTATGVGIQLGGGNNQILNNGTITVDAKPAATAESFADSDAGGTARSTAIATATATAVGIRTDDGDNSIVNNGTLTVTALPNGSATARGTIDEISVCVPFTRICATIELGNKVLSSSSPESGTAIGIETGSGNDTIVNNGTITVSKTVEDVTSSGVAIRSGAGNDTVVLGNGSTTTGSIELGEGDDTLHLVGTPTVTGSIDSGSGTNSLVFEKNGSFANSLAGFVNALKKDAGTYTLPSLPTMTGKLEVREGTLQVNSSYQMAPSSTFQTTVNADGSHGQLKVTGTAGLDGALVVEKSAGAYVNGTTYDIVSANSVSGAFDSQQLPDPTALLSFSTNQTSTTFQVQANVASLATVTRNPVGTALAKALDGVSPIASSDLGRVVGNFQQLSQRDFNRGFSSLSQEIYQPFSAATLNTLQRYNGVIHTRMNMARAMLRGQSFAEAIDRTDLAQETYLAQFGATPLTFDLFHAGGAQSARRQSGFWLSGFGNTMAQNEGSGFSGFHQHTSGSPVGFDFRLSDHLVAGVAATQSNGTLNFQDERNTGRSAGMFTTAYATYFTDSAEFEAMFSYGRDQHQTVRRVHLGDLDRRARSEHDGDIFASRFEGRYHLNWENFRIEPFGALEYSRQSIDGFRETGAGDLDLIVDQRTVDALASQLGLRLARSFSFGAGLLIPELSAAWQHDFRVGDRSIAASFRGAAQDRFRIAAPDDSGSALKLGGALTFIGNQNISAAAGITAVLGKNKPEASGLLQLQFKW